MQVGTTELTIMVETTRTTTTVENFLGTTTVATAKGTMGVETVVEAVVGTEDGGMTVPPTNVILKPEGIKVFCLFTMAPPILCLLR